MSVTGGILGAITGEFASVSNRRIKGGWAWELEYDPDGSGNNSETAAVSAVPLLAAAWLFISAIVGLTGAKRMPGSNHCIDCLLCIAHVAACRGTRDHHLSIR